MPRPTRASVISLLKRHARTLTGVALLSVLAGTMAFARGWFSDPYRFPLEVVEVKGNFRHLDKLALQEALASHVDGGFFNVDVGTIRGAAEALPWVYKATVRRVWPATLRINIEEQQAIARWGEDGYLNSHGEPFFPEALVDTRPLPRLAGPEGHEQNVLESYRRVSQTLAQLDLDVTRLELDNRRAWSMELGDNVVLELGRADTARRLQRFISAYPTVFAERIADLRRVDLRYSNGFSVHWQQLAATPEAGTQG